MDELDLQTLLDLQGGYIPTDTYSDFNYDYAPQEFDFSSLISPSLLEGYANNTGLWGSSPAYTGVDQNALITALSGNSDLYNYLPKFESPDVAYPASQFSLTNPYIPGYSQFDSQNPDGYSSLGTNPYGDFGLENMLDYGGYLPEDIQTPDTFSYDPYGLTSDYFSNPERSWGDAINDTTGGGIGAAIAKILGVNTPQQQAQRAAQQGQVSATGAQQSSTVQKIAQALAGQQAQQQTASSGQGASNALMGALAMAAALNPKKQVKIDPRGQVNQRNWNTTNQIRRGYAEGGKIKGNGGLGEILVQLVKAATEKGLIPGEDGGQDDVVDIKAAPGEYVLDAEIVSALGDGNTNSGAKKLDKMRNNIREHKRTGGLTSIPPKAKSLEEYLGA